MNKRLLKTFFFSVRCSNSSEAERKIGLLKKMKREKKNTFEKDQSHFDSSEARWI